MPAPQQETPEQPAPQQETPEQPGRRGVGRPAGITWQELAKELRDQIVFEGRRGQLPSYRELSAQHRTHYRTVLKAFEALQGEGLITIEPRRGAFVIDPEKRSTGWTLADLDEVIANLVKLREAIAADLTRASDGQVVLPPTGQAFREVTHRGHAHQAGDPDR